MKSKIIITTFKADELKINELAKELIEKQLASCINLMPKINSIYNWNNKIHNIEEVMMMIKTIEQNIDKIKAILESKHPYDIPEIICCDFDILNYRYKEWFYSNLRFTS